MAISPTSSSVISNAGQGAIRRIGNTLAGGMLKRSMGPVNADRMLDVNLNKMVLMLVALGALAYQHGHEIVNNHGDRRKWLKTLAQATVSYGIIDNAAGLYPLIGIFKGLYMTGKQPDGLRKVQEAVKISLSMLLVYTGVQLGIGMREFQHEYDERLVMNFLEDESVNKWLNEARRGAHGDKAKELYEELAASGNRNNLKKKLKDFYKEFIDDVPKGVVDEKARKLGTTADALIKERRAQINEVIQKVNILVNEPDLMKTLNKDMGAISKLANHIRAVEQPHIKLARWGSPIFMAILLGGVVGMPLIKFVNEKIAQRFPHLSKVKPDKWFEPPPPGVTPAHKNHYPDKPKLVWKDIGQMVI